MTTSATTIPNTAASAKRKSTHSQHEPVDIQKLQALTNIAATTTPNTNLPSFSNYSLSTQSANTPAPPARIRRLDLAHRADVIFNETVLANRGESIASNQQLHSPVSPSSATKNIHGSPVSPTFVKAGYQPMTRMGSIMSRRPTKVGSTSGLNTSPVHGQFINSISSESKSNAVQEDTDHIPQPYQTKNKSLRIMQDLDIGDLSFGVTDSDMVLYHQLNGMKKRKRSLAAASGQKFNEIQDEYDAQMLRQFEQLRPQRRTQGDPDAFTGDDLFDDGGDFDIQGRRELRGMVGDMDDLQNMKKRYRREVPLKEQQQPEQHFTQIRTPPPPPHPSVPPIEMPQVHVGAGTTLPSVQPQHNTTAEKPRQHSLEERKMYPSTRRSITGIEDGLQQNQTAAAAAAAPSSSIEPLNDTVARPSLSRTQSLKKLLSPVKTAGSIRSKLGSFRGKKDQSQNGDANSIYTTDTVHPAPSRPRSRSNTIDKYGSTASTSITPPLPTGLLTAVKTDHIAPTAPAHLIRKSIISSPILVPVSDGNSNNNNYGEFDTGNEYLGQPLPVTDRMIPAGIENENIPHDFRGVEKEKDKMTDSVPLSQHRYQRSSIISAVPLNADDMGTAQSQTRAETVPKINENQEPVAEDQDHETNTGADSVSSKSFDSQEDEDQRFFYTPQATMPNLNSGILLSDEPPRPAPLPPVNSTNQERPRSNTPSSSLKQIFIPTLVSNPSLPQPGSDDSPIPPTQSSNSGSGGGGGMFANLLKRGGSQLSFKRNRSKLSQLQATATNTSNLSIDTTGISNLNTNRSPTPSRLVMLANALSTTSLLPRQGTPSEQNLSEDTTNTTGPRQIHSVEDTLLADRDMNDFRVETPNDLSRRNVVLSSSGTAEDEDAGTGGGSTGIPHREEEIVTQTISVPTQMKSMSSTGRLLSQRKMSYVLEDPVAESIHSRSASNATTSTANDDMFGFDNTPKDLTFTSFKRQSSIMMPSGFSGDKLRRDLKELHSANEEHSPVNSIKSHKSAISSFNQTSTTAHHSRVRSGSIASMKSSGSGKSLMSRKSKFPKTSPTTTTHSRERSDSVINNYKPRSPTLSPNYKRFSGMSQSELLYNNNDDSSPIKQSQGQSYNPYEDDITGGNPYEQEHLEDEYDDDNPYLTWQRSQYGLTQDDNDTIPRTTGGVDVLNDVIQEDQGAEDIEGDTDTGRRMGSITDEILNEGLYD
ncbi:hypothetical protein WICPIJ_001179 [Wickerhamomyces pijperi]|uniref:Uncharacterized protein n=1 Tax=Wickerhamomyces pijperi TaxID=599730 RepID=A0A9P8QDW9_WICPI|nr:hypothetical protein WICPIJ_001179 [Wickerhamomyces pijperi]